MKKNYLIISVLLTFVAALTACSDDDHSSATDCQVALHVDSRIQTRAFDDQWESGDEIGIFMLNSQQTTVADGYSNVPYRVESAGTGGKAFSPSSTIIYFPDDDSMRDFVAYYPFSADKVTDGVYQIDLTTQDPQKNIDFMMADKVTGKSRTDASVSFQFAHKLAKIVMTIEAGDGLTVDDFKNMKVALTNQATQGTFPVLTGKEAIAGTGQKAAIDLVVTPDGKQAEGIVFPSANYDGMNFTFTTESKGHFAWALSQSTQATQFEAGKKYVYTITVNRTGLNVTSSITDWLPGNGNGETGNAE